MAASNTHELADEISAISGEIGKLLDRMEMNTPAAISGRLHDALVSVGMPEATAGEYSVGLRQFINDVRDLLDSARKQLGGAEHIAVNGPARAIKLSPASHVARRSNSLDL